MLFTEKKEVEVERFLLRLANGNCSQIGALAEGPRVDSRVNITMVVLVIPVEDRKPVVGRMFAAVTQDISNTGASLVLDRPRTLDEMILVFRSDSGIRFLRAEATHLDPMGAGFYHLGVDITRLLRTADFPELQTVRF